MKTISKLIEVFVGRPNIDRLAPLSETVNDPQKSRGTRENLAEGFARVSDFSFLNCRNSARPTKRAIDYPI